MRLFCKILVVRGALAVVAGLTAPPAGRGSNDRGWGRATAADINDTGWGY